MPYKICQQIGNRFYSFAIPKGCGRREYHIGKPTKKLKNAGPLTTFRTLRAVKSFLNSNRHRIVDHVIIAKAKIILSSECTLWVPATEPGNLPIGFPYYDSRQDRKFIRLRVPPETIFCSSVTLSEIYARVKIVSGHPSYLTTTGGDIVV